MEGQRCTRPEDLASGEAPAWGLGLLGRGLGLGFGLRQLRHGHKPGLWQGVAGWLGVGLALV